MLPAGHCPFLGRDLLHADMKTFRTLDLAVEFYRMVENLAVPGHLKDQLLRAASSISLNLAEGNAKFSYKDKKRIYQIAMGSLRESQTILKLAKVEDLPIVQAADHLGASLYKLLKSAEPKADERNESRNSEYRNQM
jgi:four helix bundle protein